MKVAASESDANATRPNLMQTRRPAAVFFFTGSQGKGEGKQVRQATLALTTSVFLSLKVTQLLSKMSDAELACTYAALILHDDGIAITADKIATVVKAAGVTIEPYWPALFAKLLERKSIEDLITNVGGGAAPAAAAGGAAAGGAAAAEEEKKESSEEEESDDDMGFSLFD